MAPSDTGADGKQRWIRASDLRPARPDSRGCSAPVSLPQAKRRDAPRRVRTTPSLGALVNFMQPVVDWFEDWWTQLAAGGKGTWVVDPVVRRSAGGDHEKRNA